MTLRELTAEVAMLGFDPSIQMDEAMLFATRRGLSTLFCELNLTKSEKFFVTARLPLTKITKFYHKGGGAEALPLRGSVYSMRVSGEGQVSIYDGALLQKHTFNTPSKRISGFLKGEGEAVFEGKLSFVITDIVTYDECFESNTEDIPDGSGRIKYDLLKMYGDFFKFASFPTDEFGEKIKGAEICGGTLYIPDNYQGEVNITYSRAPFQPSLDLADEELDLPREYSPLLPLVVASYILLDDDDEKAEIYKAKFFELLRNMKYNVNQVWKEQYVDTNGWA